MTQLLRRLLSFVCALALLAPLVHAETISYADAWVCDSSAPRPDGDLKLVAQTLRTPTRTISYYRFGNGSPIVMVTGFQATIANWNAYFLGELARHHEVIVFDNRGVGASLWQGDHYDIADLADDTAALIGALHLRDVTLLGWSMGGAIAQAVALRHPDSVQRLVLMSTLPPGSQSVPATAATLSVLAGKGPDHFYNVMAALFPPTDARIAMRCFVKNMFQPRDYHIPTISEQVVQAQTQLLAAWGKQDQTYAQLTELRIPTLVLTGTQDTILSPNNAIILGQTLPDAKRIDVLHGGHAMMYQFPRALAQSIGSFIKHTRDAGRQS